MAPSLSGRFPQTVNSLFLPVLPGGFSAPPLQGEFHSFIWEENKRPVCVRLYGAFPLPFKISTYSRNLVTQQPRPKHHLNTEVGVHQFRFYVSVSDAWWK